MPDAIPCGNEAVLFRRIPLTDICMMKHDFRMSQLGQLNHFHGYIDTFDTKPMLLQQINDSATASAPHIQRSTFMFDKIDRPLMLLDTILAWKIRSIPDCSNLVVTFCNVFRLH